MHIILSAAATLQTIPHCSTYNVITSLRQVEILMLPLSAPRTHKLYAVFLKTTSEF